MDIFDIQEIDVDQDRLDSFTDNVGQFLQTSGSDPDTFVLDLTRALDRSCLVKYFNPSYHSKHRFRKLFTHKGKAWQTPEDFVYTASEKE